MDTDTQTATTAAAAAPPGPAGPIGAGISRALVTLCATAAGFSAANIYYAQPLSDELSRYFRVGSGPASLVVTAGTVGYTVGMALLVPLGDVVDRRRLVVRMLALVAVFQAVSAAAPSLGVLIPAALIVGIGSVVSPLMVAFAGTLASADQRGRVTGRMMSGVLLGVLLARTVGGLIAQLAGWRTVYAAAAVFVAVLAVVLRRALPAVEPLERVPYPRLLKSVLVLMREEPLLRLRCAYGFLSLAGFNALWTSIAFLLAARPYAYGEAVIGLFGIVGAVGAMAARLVGRLADRGLEHGSTALLLVAILAGWGAMALHRGGWLAALLIGVVVVDFGVQGMQVLNLSVLFRLRPEARSRITTAYLTMYFLGGVAGSAASAAAYGAWGWTAVCAVGAACAALALLIWIGTALDWRRSGSAPRL